MGIGNDTLLLDDQWNAATAMVVSQKIREITDLLHNMKNGTISLDWVKKTASAITLSNGTSSSALSDLQTHADGNLYHIDEAATTPGILLIVDFVDVREFHWVQVIATYSPLISTHYVRLELYNWTTTNWDVFHTIPPFDVDQSNYSFFVPVYADYIGTGSNLGDVRVRFNHPLAGNAIHNLDIDVVALY